MNDAAGKNWDEAIIVALGSNLGGEYGSSRSGFRTTPSMQFPKIGLIVKAKSSIWRVSGRGLIDSPSPSISTLSPSWRLQLTPRDIT